MKKKSVKALLQYRVHYLRKLKRNWKKFSLTISSTVESIHKMWNGNARAGAKKREVRWYYNKKICFKFMRETLKNYFIMINLNREVCDRSAHMILWGRSQSNNRNVLQVIEQQLVVDHDDDASCESMLQKICKNYDNRIEGAFESYVTWQNLIFKSIFFFKKAFKKIKKENLWVFKILCTYFTNTPTHNELCPIHCSSSQSHYNSITRLIFFQTCHEVSKIKKRLLITYFLLKQPMTAIPH